MIFYYPTLRNKLVIRHLHSFYVRWQIICHKQKYGDGGIFDSNYCSLVKRKRANGLKHQALPQNTSTKRKHKTQPLMGSDASRGVEKKKGNTNSTK